MITYRKETTRQDFIVRTNDDGSESWIPTDPANSEYQAYIKSLEAAQSTPSVE
jgi:hypothetical protein